MQKLSDEKDARFERDILFVCLKNGAIYEIKVFENPEFSENAFSDKIVQIGFENCEWTQFGNPSYHLIDFSCSHSKYTLDLLIHGSNAPFATHVTLVSQDKVILVRQKKMDLTGVFKASKDGLPEYVTEKPLKPQKKIIYVDYLFDNYVLVVLASGKIKIADVNNPEINYLLPFQLENLEECEFQSKIQVDKNYCENNVHFNFGMSIKSVSEVQNNWFFMISTTSQKFGSEITKELDQKQVQIIPNHIFLSKIDVQLLTYNNLEIKSFEFFENYWLVSTFDEKTCFNSIEFLKFENIRKDKVIYDHVYLHEHEVNVVHTNYRNYINQFNQEINPKILNDFIFTPNLFSIQEFSKVFNLKKNLDLENETSINAYFSEIERILKEGEQRKIGDISQVSAFDSSHILSSHYNFFKALVQHVFQENEIVCLGQTFSNSNELFILRKNKKRSTLIPSTPRIAFSNFVKQEIALASPQKCYQLSLGENEIEKTQILSKEPELRFFNKKTNDFLLEIVRRLLFSIRSETKFDFYNNLTLEQLASSIIHHKKLFGEESVSVKSCFDVLLSQILGKVHDENYAIRNLIIQNKDAAINAILTLLNSLESTNQDKKEVRYPEQMPPETRVNSRSIQLVFNQIVKHCESQFNRFFWANFVIRFIEGEGLNNFLDLKEISRKVVAFNEEKLQNLLFIYFAFKAPIHTKDFDLLKDTFRFREFQSEIKEFYVGELILIQGCLEFGFENDFLLQYENTRLKLELFTDKVLDFLENKNFLNNKWQLANLCEILLKNVQ